ncbi:MAG: nucleotide exchange factor GrpE [Candidatus Ryanbacteria bacterium RIFCSPLOWO2_01_FULL_48_26]|uniref:Protein GrpE n=1 Tax=Candidatus Ryanbacteria bacterium RIFCSPLOWO2_01_FULL_48_26 TaxID=1802126 RepID=A0A1G2GR77_9BACT|nr:MAG: nucleotide exchange factor GrpE [Candidatus Ryanbacteria bacterium RIFCSPLOWO2_01_FULL_48_26]
MMDEIKNQNQNGSVAPPDEKIIAEFKEKLEQCEKQKTEYLSGWQRAKADFINYKKDEMKRMEEMARYGNEDLIRELIVILDNFDLGLRTLEKAGAVERGIYMIRLQIEEILKKRGLEKIIIKPGDALDTAVAEAIAEVESEKPPGTVIEEIEPGYRLYDKIIRSARVKVSKNKN